MRAGETWWRWGLFAAFLALTALRLPRVFFGGRFWAEEGLVFYVHAAILPWPQALFYSYAGYMNFGANLGGVLAYYLVPLDYAPRVTEALSFSVQICPALLLVISHAEWLRRPWALAAALFLLVAAPAAEEAWLNTLHSQFYLALCAGLILALEIEARGPEIFKNLLLFLAPLFGPVAIALLPLFVLRAVLERSLGRAVQMLVLGTAAAIQVLVFYTPYRHAALNLKLLLATIYAKNILVPVLGFRPSAPIIGILEDALRHGVLPWFVLISLFYMAVVLGYLLVRGPKPAWWLAAAAMVAMVFSYCNVLLPNVEQLDGHYYGRYALVPQVLFGWTVLAVASMGAGSRRRVALVLCLWLCAGSAYAYLTPGRGFDDGASWRREMVKWHQNPDYRPILWPKYGQWSLPMPLPKR